MSKPEGSNSKYSILHQRVRNEAPKLLQVNTGVGLQTVIAQIATMPARGQYKVYDDTRYGRLVTTITYPSFTEAK